MHSRAAALISALTFSILVLGATTAALAQTYQGTIRGIVRDAQGIIPGGRGDAGQRIHQRGANRHHQRSG